jgi:hypothetical protein
MSNAAPEWLDDAVPAWLAAYAAELGVAAPTGEEIEQLLETAGVAARGSRRQAAPVATWLAAKAGVTPAQALAAASKVEPQP